jgi:hypothetical protein
MLLAELRTELLNQHKALRDLSVGVGVAADAVGAEPTLLPELRTTLIDFAARVLAHNAFEERELHAMMSTIDAWGPIRDQLIDERHELEHEAILAAVRTASRETSAPAIVDATRRALADLATHMAREERELLHPDVLRDDLVTSGVGG